MAQPLVSVVLPTRRPAFVAGILGMMAAQEHRRMEVVLVLHGLGPGDLPPEAGEACRRLGVRPLPVPASRTLGDCMSAGIRAARGELIAKIDDDDIYGPGYLAEAVSAFMQGAGEVIGKAEHYTFFAETGELVLRFPGWSRGGDQRYLAGGTLLFPRALGLDPGFEALPRHVDSVFLRAVTAAGARLYATSRRHFLRRRFGGRHHTWEPEEGLLRQAAVQVRRGIVDATPASLIRLVSGA